MDWVFLSVMWVGGLLAAVGRRASRPWAGAWIALSVASVFVSPSSARAAGMLWYAALACLACMFATAGVSFTPPPDYAGPEDDYRRARRLWGFSLLMLGGGMVITAWYFAATRLDASRHFAIDWGTAYAQLGAALIVGGLAVIAGFVCKMGDSAKSRGMT
jgi:hypothetical protein